MSVPSVSICIPVFNGERFIKKTVESILAQSYEDFELVIVDNASTDGTPGIIKSFNDKRIKYHRNEKTIPAPMNWNRCISLATGSYVALYHADDIYKQDIVGKQVSVLENNPNVGAVFTEAEMIDENGDRIGFSGLPPDMRGKQFFSFKEVLVQLVRNNRNPFICPTCMARKSLYDSIPPYDYRSYKYVFDIDMYLRMAEKMDISVINEPLIDYRIHSRQGSMSYASEERDHNEVYDMYDKFISRYRSLLSGSDLAKYESFRLWDFTPHAIKAFHRGDPSTGKKLLWKSFSWARIFTSFFSIPLFIRLCISSIFIPVAYLGLGKIFADIYVRRVRMSL